MNAGLSEQQLAGIAAREAAATPGPWGVYDDGTARLDIVAGLEETGAGYTGRREIAQTVESPMDNDPSHVSWGEDEDDAQCRADGVFIAHAREDVPALLAEVARLRANYAEAVATVARLEQKRAELERIANAERERVAELEAERRSASEALAEAADEVENLLAEHESGTTSCHAFGAALAQMYGRWRTGNAEPGAQPSPVFVCAFDDNGQPVQGGAR